MSVEYPLFPELSEQAKIEAEQIMERFRVRLKEIADETLGELYRDVSMYIESDHWSNFRNELLDGLLDYSNSRIQAKYDFKRIREKIFEEHRAELVGDLNKDLIHENERLKRDILKQDILITEMRRWRQ